MTSYEKFSDIIDAHAKSDDMVAYVAERMAKFEKGDDVALDFLTRPAVGAFCTALGFGEDRNWAALDTDTIAPAGAQGVPAVPADEGKAVLEVLQGMITKGQIKPTSEGGKDNPTILNDFLPVGQNAGKPTHGNLWEFCCALAVELEHGRMHGTNVTNNHPLITGFIVLAHLAEDHLYYARLRCMEAEGDLFNAILEKQSADELRKTLDEMTQHRRTLADREAEAQRDGAAS